MEIGMDVIQGLLQEGFLKLLVFADEIKDVLR